MFDIFQNILNEPFVVLTPVGELVDANRLYRNFPIVFLKRVSYVELVELDMLNFYVFCVWIG